MYVLANYRKVPAKILKKSFEFQFYQLLITSESGLIAAGAQKSPKIAR